ncbi:MAG TPA: hypothetical protein PKO15_18675 [Fibrobacteria bacterium]|nr:hypothetical protein [Fibrobacteria bacterium]
MKKEYWIFAKLGIALLVSLVAWKIWGYSYGILTNEYHSTIVLRISRMAMFPGDAMAATLTGYASPLWSVVGILAKIVPIKTLFIMGFLFARALFAFALGELVASFVADESSQKTAWIAGALATLGNGWMVSLPVGGDPVFGTYFSQTFISLSLILLAIGSAYRGSLIKSACFLGLAIDVNIMQSLFGSLIVGILWIRILLVERDQVRKRFCQAVGLILVIGAPGLVFTIQSMASATHGLEAMSGSQLAGWARFWLKGHFFADDRSPMWIAAMISLLISPVLLQVALPRSRFSKRLTVLAAFVPCLLAGLQILLVQTVPSRLLFQLHLFRSDVFAYSMAVAGSLAVFVESIRRRENGITLPLAIVATILAGYFQHSALLLGLLLVERMSHPVKVKLLICAASIVAGFSLWSFFGGNKGGAILCLTGLLGSVTGYLPGTFPKRISVVLTSVIGVLAILLGVNFWRKEWLGKNYAALYGESTLIAKQLSEFGRSSPPEALFILPPSVNARPFLERGVWFNMDDGATFLWRSGAESETLRRMKILGIQYDLGSTMNPDSLDRQWERGLCSSLPILQKEGVTHVVLPNKSVGSRSFVLHNPVSAQRELGCQKSASGGF